ncbi:MAG: AMP-binding protein, partial [Candidatus Margulisbacteria bacterium]|nr:AMP-binding protein [Candidatus Margulisiibacteriota bacterium]
MQVATIKELLEQSVASFSKRIAFQIKDGFDYRKLTYTDVDRLIKKVQAQLTSLGVAKGDRVALISENRPEWPIAYLAVTSLGAIVVPLDAMLNKEDILPLINNAGVKAGIVSQKYIGYITATDIENQKIVMEDFGQLPELGTTEQAEVYASDVASIVYTSGTTGVPKGIVLTHKNIVSNVVSVASLFDFGPKDNFLSVLPLHHAFETTAGFLAPFSLGCKITYAESLKSYAILNNMQKSSVTVMCGVPLLYQLFYDGIMREVEEKKLGKLFSLLFFLSKFVKHVIGLNIGKVLFKIIHKKFGGNIRFFVSGGAALDPELALNFDLMGF